MLCGLQMVFNIPCKSKRELASVAFSDGAWVMGRKNNRYPFKMAAMKRRKASWISSSSVWRLFPQLSSDVSHMLGSSSPSGPFWPRDRKSTNLLFNFIIYNVQSSNMTD